MWGQEGGRARTPPGLAPALAPDAAAAAVTAAAAAAVATSALVAEPRLRTGMLSVLYSASSAPTPPSRLEPASLS